MSKSSREADRVIAKISYQLSTNALKVGDKLPTEAELCTEFNVSRTVVREALQQLKAIGVLTTVTGSGSYVSEGSLDGMQNSLEFFAIMTGDADSWFERLDIRALLESSCARKLAGENYSTKRIKTLRAAHEEMAKHCDNHTLFSEADVKFHEVLIAASGNKIAAAMLKSLRNLQLRFSKETYKGDNSDELMKRNLEEHLAILEAIENQDPDAAETAMKDHLIATRENLLLYIKNN